MDNYNYLLSLSSDDLYNLMQNKTTEFLLLLDKINKELLASIKEDLSKIQG